VARPALALAITLGSVSCGDMVTQGRSPSYLIMDSLTAAAGSAKSLTYTGVLRSDVQTRGGVFEDNGRVALRLAMKDVTATSPTSTNAITVTRFRVVFRRADGRNTPGVDVPYPFDGGMTITVGGSTAVEGDFSIVRAQAKLEAPLIAMAGLGGSIVISTLADVTFYGHDQAGNEVSVTGTISVNFADWADEE